MAYDEKLADRVRLSLGKRIKFGEIAMFGGLCFTDRGNMCIGVMGDDLMVRVGPDAHDESIKRPGARIMDFAKRPMKGFLYVDKRGHGTSRSLDSWVDRALAFSSDLPAKKAAKRKAK